MNADDRQPSVWRSGLTLGVLAAVCAALVAVTWHLTRTRIAANERAALEQSLKPTLSDVFYDSNLSESRLIIESPHELPGTEDAIVYRVYSQNEPVAAAFVVTEPDGFSGPIRLLIGIEYSGEVTGVQVLAHEETPGIGDMIEASNSDWLELFRNATLESPPRDRWAIRKDGGAFDQLTGASVTTRAVTRAVKETLLYLEKNRDSIFATAGMEGTQQRQ
jgi:Na+-translocating ferredoxin:NAD+ oxidoreductase subunit G